jgi:hypothetical protein
LIHSGYRCLTCPQISRLSSMGSKDSLRCPKGSDHRRRRRCGHQAKSHHTSHWILLHARAQTRTLTIARSTYRSCASQPHSHARVTWVTAHSLSRSHPSVCTLLLTLNPLAHPPHASPHLPLPSLRASPAFSMTMRSRMSHATGMRGLCSARRQQRRLQIALHFRRAASHSLGRLAA